LFNTPANAPNSISLYVSKSKVGRRNFRISPELTTAVPSSHPPGELPNPHPSSSFLFVVDI
jgi:hypothetical protein